MLCDIWCLQCDIWYLQRDIGCLRCDIWHFNCDTSLAADTKTLPDAKGSHDLYTYPMIPRRDMTKQELR